MLCLSRNRGNYYISIRETRIMYLQGRISSNHHAGDSSLGYPGRQTGNCASPVLAQSLGSFGMSSHLEGILRGSSFVSNLGVDPVRSPFGAACWPFGVDFVFPLSSEGHMLSSRFSRDRLLPGVWTWSEGLAQKSFSFASSQLGSSRCRSGTCCQRSFSLLLPSAIGPPTNSPDSSGGFTENDESILRKLESPVTVWTASSTARERVFQKMKVGMASRENLKKKEVLCHEGTWIGFCMLVKVTIQVYKYKYICTRLDWPSGRNMGARQAVKRTRRVGFQILNVELFFDLTWFWWEMRSRTFHLSAQEGKCIEITEPKHIQMPRRWTTSSTGESVGEHS